MELESTIGSRNTMKKVNDWRTPRERIVGTSLITEGAHLVGAVCRETLERGYVSKSKMYELCQGD